MRYSQVDTVSFEDVYGKTHAVKDLREIPTYVTLDTVKVYPGDRIDEIATREEFYGNDAEGECYKIFDHNIEELTEAGFDMSKIKSLKVPVR